MDVGLDLNLLKALLWREREKWLCRKNRFFMAFLSMALLLPGSLCVLLGWHFAKTLPQVSPNQASGLWMAGIIVLATISAIWDGTLALEIRTLRPFETRPFALFQGEMLLSLLTPFKLIFTAFLALFAFGACLKHPSLFFWLWAGIAFTLMALICLERILGRITRTMSQRFKAALIILAALPLLRLLLDSMAQEVFKRSLFPQALPLDGIKGYGIKVLNARPNLFPIEAWQSGLQGQSAWMHGFLKPLVLSALILSLTFWFLRRDFQEEAQSNASKGGRLWDFDQAWMGVARHRWESIWASKQGRFFILLPLVMPLIQVDAMFMTLLPGPAFLMGATGWMMMGTGSLACTQFGLDRASVRHFWVLPIEDRDLLLGKVLGVAAYQLVSILLFMVLLSLATPLPLKLLPAAFLFCASLATLQLKTGLFHSIHHPRPLDPKGLNPGEGGIEHGRRIGRVLLPWAALTLLWIAGSRLNSAGITSLMGLTLLFSLWRLQRALPKAARELNKHRDQLSKTLEAA